MVECELSKIMITETSEQQVIVLKEKSGERSFPILIGIFEAAAIDRRIRDLTPPRPMTHDLLASVISGLEAQLTRVEVSALKNNTFYARLVIQQDDKVTEIDSRPSDAIAIAVRAEAPIFVAEEVLEEVCSWQKGT